MIEREKIDDVAGSNPQVDASAIERSRELVRRLASAGIQVEGYRLAPPLGGTILLEPQPTSGPVSHNR